MISYNAIRKNKTLFQVLPAAVAVALEEDLKKEAEAKENKDAKRSATLCT